MEVRKTFQISTWNRLQCLVRFPIHLFCSPWLLVDTWQPNFWPRAWKTSGSCTIRSEDSDCFWKRIRDEMFYFLVGGFKSVFYLKKNITSLFSNTFLNSWHTWKTFFRWVTLLKATKYLDIPRGQAAELDHTHVPGFMAQAFRQIWWAAFCLMQIWCACLFLICTVESKLVNCGICKDVSWFWRIRELWCGCQFAGWLLTATCGFM